MNLLLLALSVPSLHAELPLPTFPQCGEIDRPDLCPNDLNQSWWQISYIPVGSRGSVRPEELAIGSGNRNDRAWRITTGRWDVLLAVADSGIDWGEGSYRNKIALNLGELPLPQRADGSVVENADLDGNGLVNVQDYAQDTRVDLNAGRDMADGVLDPSDLIYTFSDGVDDDGNGLVDDIAGWDFFADDNDPFHEYDDGFGTHGSGVVEDMAAEGGDGGGGVGVCPNCAVLPIRIGDTFITDGNRAAMALLYAADRGAVVVNYSVGALTHPDTMIQAAAWARENGISIAGAAGDENAYHANFPALVDGSLFVHSIRANTDDENVGTYSYLNFFNCNNYGPRVVLVADSPACATGATAITTGAVGLLHSAARDRGITLAADEVYQLLVTTATDIHLSAEDVERAATYPSGAGWDPFYGYGRLDIGAAVEAVAAGRIPPMLDIDGPGWLETVDPSVGTLSLTGRVAAPRAAGVRWTFEVGEGANPQTWSDIASGDGPVDGVLGTLDLSTLPGEAPGEAPREETIVERVERVMAPQVTLRLRATDSAGVNAQYQESFFVRRDPDLLPGFPLKMPGSGESSPILADLDEDGIFEIVIADGAGWVHAYTGTGAELDGWPVRTPEASLWREELALEGVPELGEGVIATVAVGDLDGDGRNEVVVGTGQGNVHVWTSAGEPFGGFPVSIVGRRPEEFDRRHVYDNGIAGAPTLYDLDGDGQLEILVAAMDQRLYVWDSSGAPWGPYPVEVCAPELCGVAGTRIISSPTVGDVDGDGDVEIGLGTNEAVNRGNASISYLLDALTGTSAPGWPITETGLINEAGLLPVVGEGHPASLAFADLDRDGDLEISSPIMLGQTPIYAHDGSVAVPLAYNAATYGEGSNTNQPSFVQMTNNPSFGDLTGDGVPEHIIGGAGAYYLVALPIVSAIDWQNVVAAWDGATGKMLPGWPRQIEDLQFLVAPAVAEISGDSQPEAIMGSAGWLLHAWDKDGNEPAGWPKFTGNWILGSPAVGDIDGDGLLEVVVSTREGNLFAWHTQGHADQAVGWAGMHHDPQNTGNHETPLQVQAGPPEELVEGGCCGDKEESGAESALLLAPLALLARRRRRG